MKAHQLDFRFFGNEMSEVMELYDQPIIYRNIEELGKLGLPFI